MMSIVAMLASIGIIFITLVIWQIITKRDNAKDMNMVANLMASILFWGVIIVATFFLIIYS